MTLPRKNLISLKEGIFNGSTVLNDIELMKTEYDPANKGMRCTSLTSATGRGCVKT